MSQRRLSRDKLLEFDSDPRLGKFVCDQAGLACAIGEKQTWHLGGHELTVELQLDKRLFYVLYIRAGWPRSPDIRRRRSLCLAELYAIALTRTIRDFHGPELARFKVKALIAAGLVQPTTISLPELPANAPAPAVATWRLIEELATERATGGETWPMPLVAPWLASRNGTSEEAVRTGKRWLERNGWIVHVDNAPGRFGKATKLWQVGVEADAP